MSNSTISTVIFHAKQDIPSTLRLWLCHCLSCLQGPPAAKSQVLIFVFLVICLSYSKDALEIGRFFFKSTIELIQGTGRGFERVKIKKVRERD